jgi:uncharacterized protein
VSDETTYHFEWDPAKARINVRKHAVTFQRATLVFRDPLALSVYDAEHSDTEDRWATLGLTADGEYLVVIHTWTELGGANVGVRIISAQPATKAQIKQYESAPRG